MCIYACRRNKFNPLEYQIICSIVRFYFTYICVEHVNVYFVFKCDCARHCVASMATIAYNIVKRINFVAIFQDTCFSTLISFSSNKRQVKLNVDLIRN